MFENFVDRSRVKRIQKKLGELYKSQLTFKKSEKYKKTIVSQFFDLLRTYFWHSTLFNFLINNRIQLLVFPRLNFRRLGQNRLSVENSRDFFDRKKASDGLPSAASVSAVPQTMLQADRIPQKVQNYSN